MDQPSDSDDYELMPKKEIDRLRKEISVIKKNPYGVSDKGQDLQQSIERLNSTLNKFISILEDAQQDIIDEYQESKPVEKLNQILDQNETIARALISINDSLKKSSGDQSGQSSQSSQSNQTSQYSRQSQSSQSPDTAYPDFSMPTERPQSPVQQQPQQQPNVQPQFQQQQFPQQPISTQQMNPTSMQPNMPPNMNRPQFAQQPIQRPTFVQPNMQQMQQPMMQPGMQQNMPSMNNPNQYSSQQFGNLPPLDGLSLDSIPPLDAPNDLGNMLPEKKKKFLGLL